MNSCIVGGYDAIVVSGIICPFSCFDVSISGEKGMNGSQSVFYNDLEGIYNDLRGFCNDFGAFYNDLRGFCNALRGFYNDLRGIYRL
jgi:hypothetical protein